MKRIFTSLAPNMESDDRRVAACVLANPYSWHTGSHIGKLEQWFVDFTGAAAARSFTSGRGALYAILKSLELPKGSEVLLQAYTCVAVPDPVLWAGLVPVYVDCDATLTMAPVSLEQRITANSRVLIVQHTFGQSADMEKLMKVAKKHNLFVIEDCAHALGATRGGKKIGSFGDAAFFSFGRDKVLSSVFGGVAVVHKAEAAKKLIAVHDSFALARTLWILQQLMHPQILGFAKKFYDFFSLGKIKLELAKRLRIISKAVYPMEKSGGAPYFVFRKMPNAMAELALYQIAKLERFNTHRREIAAYYQNAGKELQMRSQETTSNEGIFLRYAVFHPRAREIVAYARRRRIELGDWYTSPVAPAGVDYKAVGYVEGSCPVAEHYASQTFNLPTHIAIMPADAKLIIEMLKNCPLWKSEK